MSNPFLAGSWREAMQKVSRTIDQSFGELAILTRCDRRVQRMIAARKIASVKLGKRPNMPAEPDPSMGVFSYRSKLTMRDDSSWRSGRSQPAGLVESRDPVVSFSGVDLPFNIRGGDRIQRCGNGDMFQVTEIRPDGVSRTELVLNQLGLVDQ